MVLSKKHGTNYLPYTYNKVATRAKMAPQKKKPTYEPCKIYTVRKWACQQYACLINVVKTLSADFSTIYGFILPL